MEYSEASPEPHPDEVDTDVFAPMTRPRRRYRSRAQAARARPQRRNMRQISYAQALVEAQREEMLRDERVFIMGEDVGLYGGAYGATRGLAEEFGDWRVLDTPISEASIGGAAVGARP
jgi:2-oxoisovalerate dehydrogenase E1 component